MNKYLVTHDEWWEQDHMGGAWDLATEDFDTIEEAKEYIQRLNRKHNMDIKIWNLVEEIED